MFNICIRFVNGEEIHIRSEEMPEPNDDKTMLRITNADTDELFISFTSHILYFTVKKKEQKSPNVK